MPVVPTVLPLPTVPVLTGASTYGIGLPYGGTYGPNASGHRYGTYGTVGAIYPRWWAHWQVVYEAHMKRF